MNRITVEIYVPAAGRSFDVTIPENLPLRQVTELAAGSLSELSGGLYQADADSVEAISGATRTSTAVNDGVNHIGAYLLRLMESSQL